ncbi:MAG TPA: PrsW family glutamic-type intramembrane protease [Streptosporangiaceae bacterium]|nr:PrsW family glutamic-type intramembrane protease [Streptosporangiaceae bacterium]
MAQWIRDPALRSWPVLLLVILVVVPPSALVLLNGGTMGDLNDAGWIFAYYFAIAWMLLLGVIVRPQHVSRAMLAVVAVVGIVTQVPIAVWLEMHLHDTSATLISSIFTIGIPEELAKAIPIVVVAVIWRSHLPSQTPRDYLFVGAVSGLVFGAAEVERYFTVMLGSISGGITDVGLQALTLEYVWRFLTDPIGHACWAGITGYFIGLAITGPVKRYGLALVGLLIAAVLHGLNDWQPINAHLAWVLIVLISVLLFIGYARAGAAIATPEPVSAASAASPAVPAAAQGYPQAQPVAQGQPPGWPPGPAAAPAAGSAYLATNTVIPRPGEAPAQPGGWWQQPRPAAAAPQPAYAQPPVTQPGQPAYQPTSPPVTASQRTTPKPWWEQ